MSTVHLGYDTSETPNINLEIVMLKSEKDLWSSIVSRLDIGIKLISYKARRAKINYFDFSLILIIRSKENVFWL
jgi:hypothetical protein